jgi:sterol 14-demethylase
LPDLAPVLTGGWPWLGHAASFSRRPIDLLRNGRERFGEVFRFRLMGQWVNVYTGPAANTAFFRAPDEQLSAREAYQFTVPIFGKGVAYDAEPHLMDEQLRLVHPALTDARLQLYAQAMEEEAHAYFDAWGGAGEADLLEAMNDLTVFIASRCLIGREFRGRLSGEFARLYRNLEEGLNLIGFLRPEFPLPAHRRRDRARTRIAELLAPILAERRSGRAQGEDFLQTLMEARYENGRALSDHEIVGLLITLIFAGQHTSAVLAAWAGILLVRHPSERRAVEEELESARPGEPLSLERLQSLFRLERAIKEAERLYPPLVMLMRKVRADFVYADVLAPAGDLAMVSPAVSHRIPEIFTEPDRYDPERFAPGREEDRKARFTLIGFGGGKHRCIGMVFAYQQIKVIWSTLLRRFDLELVGPAPVPDHSTWVVGPRQPCRVRYRRKSVPARSHAIAYAS